MRFGRISESFAFARQSYFLPLCLAAAAFMPALCRSCVACFSAAAAFFSAGVSTCFSTLGRFFLVFLLLGRFLDPGKLAQDLHALLESFRAAIQLNGKNILHDLVELRT